MKTSEEIFDECLQARGIDRIGLQDAEVYEAGLDAIRQALSIADFRERFSSEGEILQWLCLNTPIAIKPKSKHAKTLLVNPFTSNHAFEEVCKHLANKLYNAR